MHIIGEQKQQDSILYMSNYIWSDRTNLSNVNLNLIRSRSASNYLGMQALKCFVDQLKKDMNKQTKMVQLFMFCLNIYFLR